jgi:hypothetical protein
LSSNIKLDSVSLEAGHIRRELMAAAKKATKKKPAAKKKVAAKKKAPAKKKAAAKKKVAAAVGCVVSDCSTASGTCCGCLWHDYI